MSLFPRNIQAAPSDLFRAATIYGAPTYVKQASEADLLGDDTMEFAAFALPGRREFPIHTKAATWMSAVRLAESGLEGSELSAAASAIDRAIEVWGIESDIRAAFSKAATAYDSATIVPTTADFAYTGPDGVPRLPVRDGSEAIKAAEWMSKYRSRFRHEDRSKIAQFILTKAAKFGVDLGEHGEALHRTAGIGVAAPDAAQEMLLDRALRAKAVNCKEASAAYAEIGASVVEDPNYDPIKAAAAVDAIDRSIGFDTQYGHGMSLPEDVLCAVTIKVASDYAGKVVELKSGSVYSLDDLAGIRAMDLCDWLGTKAAAEVSRDGIHVNREKAAEAMPEWDRATADDFDLFALQAGIVPEFKTGPSSPRGLTRADLAFLAG